MSWQMIGTSTKVNSPQKDTCKIFNIKREWQWRGRKRKMVIIAMKEDNSYDRCRFHRKEKE